MKELSRHYKYFSRKNMRDETPQQECLQVKGSETTLSFSLALWSGSGNVRQMPSKAETQGQETFPHLSHCGGRPAVSHGRSYVATMSPWASSQTI